MPMHFRRISTSALVAAAICLLVLFVDEAQSRDLMNGAKGLRRLEISDHASELLSHLLLKANDTETGNSADVQEEEIASASEDNSTKVPDGDTRGGAQKTGSPENSDDEAGQLTMPTFNNRPSQENEEKRSSKGGSSQKLVSELVENLKESVSQDRERLARALPVWNNNQGQGLSESEEPKIASSLKTLEDISDHLASQVSSGEQIEIPVGKASISQLSGDGGIVVGRTVSAQAPNNEIYSSVVVGPVLRPVNIPVSVQSVPISQSRKELKVAKTVENFNDGTSTSLSNAINSMENSVHDADVSDPTEDRHVVKNLIAKLKSTQNQLAVANRAQMLLSARKKALEMKLGEVREAVEEQERADAQAKRDAAVGLNVKVKSTIPTVWRPWESQQEAHE